MSKINRLSILIFLFVLTNNLIPAGIPGGYYDAASGKSGTELKAALHGIVKNHTRYPYTGSGTDVWDLLKITDEDPENSANVILLYSGRSHPKSDNSGENLTYTGDRWNREHVWAKSHGFPSESDTAYTDIHHLRPADESVNTDRNNREFDECTTAHTEAIGCYYDTEAWTWEPRDAVKGDVARMMFYMVVRYDPGKHSDDSEYDLELVDSTGNNAENSPLFGKLSTLLTWHNDDPVDNWERTRNDTIYHFQGNRNPFIDHPEYAVSIWGSSNTTVQFSAFGATVTEGAGTYNLTASLSNMSATTATTAQVAITGGSGSAADINNYTTQTVTFPANSSADQTISLTLTDDAVFEGSETITFALQNVSGGNSAASGYPGEFTLTISENDAPPLYISEVSEGNADYTTEFLEIYNSSSATVDLTGYKLVMASASTNTSEYVFDIGSDGEGGDVLVPAGGLWVISRGADRSTFEAAFSSFPSAAKFYDGNTSLFFGTSTARRWRLRGSDGSANADDGTLFDDTGAAAGGDGLRTIQNPIGTFTPSSSANGINSTPGQLDGDQSLAVELYRFSGRSAGGQVLLEWSTASEMDNLGFILYRRDNYSDFQKIADYLTDDRLQGQGSVSRQTDYQFSDRQVRVGQTYYYTLADIDYNGFATSHGPVAVTVQPAAFGLASAWPNPFNPRTNITFNVANRDSYRVAVFDIAGRLVTVLNDGPLEPGQHTIVWDGRTTSGTAAASGCYLLRLESGTMVQTGKLLLTR
ncbi:MAG: endonuclease [Candidatus Neomarinimicrobiota bacterium]